MNQINRLQELHNEVNKFYKRISTKLKRCLKTKWYWWLLVAIYVLLGISALLLARPLPTLAILLWVIAGAFYWVGQRRAAKEAQ